MSFQTRNLSNVLSDSKQVMIAVWQTLALALVAMLVTALTGHVPLVILVRTVAVVLGANGMCAAIVWPKMWMAQTWDENMSTNEFMKGFETT